jgi:hypothetical protein
MKKFFGFIALFALGLLLWQATYSDRYDPKGLHYVLWKYHLAPMNLDRASSIVVMDRDRDAMILGRTKEQLSQRFGYLKSPVEVRPYLRDYCWASRPGSDAVFLRDVDLMIVFSGGRAVETITCND